MKKWFEHQDSNTEKIKTKIIVYCKPLPVKVADLILDTILKNNNNNNKKSRPLFFREKHANNIAELYAEETGIDKNQLIEWVIDPEYAKLLDSDSFVQHELGKSVRLTLKKILEKYIPINWIDFEEWPDSFQFYMQMPGQMTPLHYDRKKTDVANNDKKIRRYLIFLEDQKPGQCFFMGDEECKWSKGTIITWNHTEFHHGGANWGYWPRPVLNISGIEK